MVRLYALGSHMGADLRLLFRGCGYFVCVTILIGFLTFYILFIAYR